MAAEMIIIVYSGTRASTVGKDLGKADYSYYFILQKYLPLLQDLGEVRVVEDPEREVDPIHAEATARGDTAIFLSFSPPHITARHLQCPTVCVMAWEFGSIPDEDWDAGGLQVNWVKAIREIGNVLTISDYATRVIRRQVGAGPRVVTIPAPVDSLAVAACGGDNDRKTRPPLLLGASVVDSRECDIDEERATVKNDHPGSSTQGVEEWDGREVSWAFVSKGDSAGQYLVGFYAEEHWGCWSRTATPEIILPWFICGEFEIELMIVGYGENQGRTITVRVGNCSRDVVLPPVMTRVTLHYKLSERACGIHFSGLVAVPLPGARDHRTLGLGLKGLTIRSRVQNASGPVPAAAPGEQEATPEQGDILLQLDGTVYTSVFNPEDGRKNWKDIVTAFCWAFREDPNKTLVLKMSHHNKSVFMGDLLLLFSKLYPFRCRIVAVHGFLSSDELSALKGVTDFYVNASGAEGQCLPLLEFMVEGVPAIAPNHTAMESYITAENSFIVRSSLEPQAWPIDPRRAYRTTTQRIDWDSLRRCFLESAAVMEREPDRYCEMSKAAAASVAEQFSSHKVSWDLAGFLDIVANGRKS